MKQLDNFKRGFMRKLILLFFGFILISFPCFAKGDPLLGKWVHKEADKTEVYEFFGNGKGHVKHTGGLLDADMHVKYELIGQDSVKIHMNLGDQPLPPTVFKYKISAKKLILITPEGDQIQYQRAK